MLDEWRGLDAILLGAVGTPDVPPGVIERGLLLKMRFDLDLYINQRPFVDADAGIDLVVIRENTEGTYAGEGGFLRKGTPARGRHPGLGQHPHGRRALRPLRLRAGRVPQPQAPHAGAQDQRAHLRRRPVAAHVRRGGAPSYPDVATAYNHVDAACIYFVSDPQRYDVIVTDNLFGDILTDLGGAVSGGIGFAASGNLNPARTGPSMFEPVHGSAPDIAGQAKANPIAAILSAAMMLDFLGEADAAARIRKACADPSAQAGSTPEIGDALAARV